MKLDKKDIAGVIILYNSSIDVVNNIATYIDQIQHLYVVDNSIIYNAELIRLLHENPKIQYHSLDGNQGIAVALNWGAEQAIADGFTVLLTMDDDTSVPDRMILQMIDFWNCYSKPVGILSGVHHDRPAKTGYKCLSYTLTSGNLLNLVAYQQVGRFNDGFFIDHVDHEYGFRLNTHGYQVIELPDIHLKHKLGYSQQIKVGSWVIRKYGTNTPIRLYYYARNGIYVARTYHAEHPEFAWMFTKEMIRRWIKTLVLDKDRLIRVKMLVKGLTHGWRGRLGQLQS